MRDITMTYEKIYAKSMTTQEINKTVLRQLLEITDKGEIDVTNYYHADFVEHNEESVVNIEGGQEGIAKAFAIFSKAFPNRKHIIEDMIAEGDKVAARITFIGTFERPVGNVKPDGKEYRMTGTTFYKFKEGKILEKWTQISVLDVLNINKDEI